ncbi:MAG TPA: hypothetical protein VJ792_04590 [Candidatus Nitrosotalea sp.]|nr:hypothetical protein [Candidatus Nitrosotalea sp.]
MSDFLARNGFEMTNQFELKMMDYSDVLDFRTKKKLSRSIVRHDLRLVRECDVMVVLATPSFGAAMEMFFAKNLGKRTVLLSDGPIPSPWPVNFADFIVNDKDSLLRILRRIKGKA